VRLRFFGGLALEGSGGEALVVAGRGQQALLYRLALDAGTTVAYPPRAQHRNPAGTGSPSLAKTSI
jgi:hypothetical protein